MRNIQISILLVLTLFIIGQTSASDRAYVVSSLKITVRTGPSNENKIIAFVNSGQLVNIIETKEDWCRVEIIEDDKVEKEGWVLKQYLTDRIPYKIQTDTLMNENKELTEKLSSIKIQFDDVQNQKEELSILYQRSQEELLKLQEEYDSLKLASSGYLKLKAELDTTKAKYDSLKKRVEELDVENTSLRKSQKNIWFATGALVLLCGLMIGFIIGKQSKKRRSEYY